MPFAIGGARSAGATRHLKCPRWPQASASWNKPLPGCRPLPRRALCSCSWGGWSDLPLLLIDRINNMKRIILLHFLIMLKSIPCLVQRPLLKAELVRYRTPPPGFTPMLHFSHVKNGPHVSVADSTLGSVTSGQLHQNYSIKASACIRDLSNKSCTLP